jgi:hypothetical protein
MASCIENKVWEKQNTTCRKLESLIKGKGATKVELGQSTVQLTTTYDKRRKKKMLEKKEKKKNVRWELARFARIINSICSLIVNGGP